MRLLRRLPPVEAGVAHPLVEDVVDLVEDEVDHHRVEEEAEEAEEVVGWVSLAVAMRRMTLTIKCPSPPRRLMR